MAGHRDDGTFAEDKAHHPNRKVDFQTAWYNHTMKGAAMLFDALKQQPAKYIEPDQANPLGMVRPETNAIPDMHDPARLGEHNHDMRVNKQFNIFDTDALEAEAKTQAQYWAEKNINPSDMADLQERAEKEGW